MKFYYFLTLILFSTLLLIGCTSTNLLDCQDDGIYCLQIVAILENPIPSINPDWTVYTCLLDEVCEGFLYDEKHGYSIDASFGFRKEQFKNIEIYEGASIWTKLDNDYAIPLIRPTTLPIIDVRLIE